jgi:hypothetical protein
MKRRVHRVDANQKEILQVARQMGAMALPITDLGQGAPDVLIAWRGSNYLWEIKNKAGKNIIGKEQQDWMDNWRGQVCVIRTTQEAIEFLNSR